MSDPSASVVVVESRDRLAWFGVEHLETAFAAHGRLVVAEHGETADDLIRDMIGVLTSMCVRLYGLRGTRRRAVKALVAVTATKQEPTLVGV